MWRLLILEGWTCTSVKMTHIRCREYVRHINIKPLVFFVIKGWNIQLTTFKKDISFSGDAGYMSAECENEIIKHERGVNKIDFLGQLKLICVIQEIQKSHNVIHMIATVATHHLGGNYSVIFSNNNVCETNAWETILLCCQIDIWKTFVQSFDSLC